MNVREVLREANMDFGDVANVTAFVADFKDFDAYNKVYREFFPKDTRARDRGRGRAEPGRRDRATDDRGPVEMIGISLRAHRHLVRAVQVAEPIPGGAQRSCFLSPPSLPARN